MKKIKQLFSVLIIFLGLIFLFGPAVLPENDQFRELLDSASGSDVIIVFNSGGWGNTPLEKADDFFPIITGIKKTLDDWGYRSVVIPYERTKNGFLGKITGAKEEIKSFPKASEQLVKEVEEFLKENQGKKIIMAGLSNGAAFVDETTKNLDEFKDSVLAIEAGVPFWHSASESENALQLDNNGKDSLAVGRIGALLNTLFKTSFKWFMARISGDNIPMARAFQAPGHQYLWSSPEVGPQIVNFLEEKIR